MKKTILLPLLSALMLPQANAGVDPTPLFEDAYLKAANTLLFFTSENIISSGSYEFGSSEQTLDTLLFPMSFVPLLAGTLLKVMSYESMFILSSSMAAGAIYFATRLSNVDKLDNIETKDD